MYVRIELRRYWIFIKFPKVVNDSVAYDTVNGSSYHTKQYLKPAGIDYYHESCPLIDHSGDTDMVYRVY